MKTIIKTVSALGLAGILCAGVYINLPEENNSVSIPETIEQFVITGIEKTSVEIPLSTQEPIAEKPVKPAEIIPSPEPVIVEPEPVVEEIKQPEPIQPIVKETPKPVKKEKVEQVIEKPKTDNISAIDRAKSITAGYCAPELWVKWNPGDGNNSNRVGQASRDIKYWQGDGELPPDIQTITTMISPELDGEIDSATHTAWHECAHAKVYSINPEQTDSIIEQVKKEFPEGKHIRGEQLADAMATVKTGSTKENYYKKDFTKSQLDLAAKIWELSPEIKTEMEYPYKAFLKINEIH